MNKKDIFTNQDYNSGDGMITSVWGPPMWHILHTLSFNYPVKPTKEQKNIILIFIIIYKIYYLVNIVEKILLKICKNYHSILKFLKIEKH